MNTFMKSDRILVAGGTGFIGGHLAARCLRDTPFVSCLSLGGDRSDIFPDSMEFLKADMSDAGWLKDALSGRVFDYVINLSGYIDHTDYFSGGRRVVETHLTGLLNLLDCLDIKRLKGFVQIGSSDEYGGAQAPQREDMREMPISPYSLAKTSASHFIQMLHRTVGFPGVVLRLFLVYGPGQDDRRFLPQIINACLKNDEFKTSEGKQLRDFCYVEDAVDAMAVAAVSRSSRGYIINIASGMPVSIRDVINKVSGLTGGGKPLWGTYPYRKGENMALYADISLAKKILGWTPAISLDDGLQRTIEYYKKQLSSGAKKNE